MDNKLIAKTIDHAVLKPDATDADVERECNIALRFDVASVCVKPCHVKLAHSFLKGSDVMVSTVIGFPHGGTTTACKVAEAFEAIEHGALELDMVINIGKLLSGDYIYVKNDIEAVAKAAHSKNVILKVIIETSLLDDENKKIACRLSEEAGSDYVKTSTGFNGSGAAPNDIVLMKNVVGPHIKVKASGGIKTLDQAIGFIELGCHRLGTSSTEQILTGVDKQDKSLY
ncbi:deoxyribose-phosphate aldolase [Pseudobacteroides cellulosolvens]|uniref:Deoxyribose-phosphate aldolase n=1 Tax=Pseudobacteroides cellulosolvens ATCC 35603 = DSM 2933 TaxID=398512 RepID=A0A0L6JMT4_9FIRM|nr:deoxyribose-phosphate aldolase [Pseudobacteroides cellulosolvens]KNY27111.1 Deoxyribose-phosphate aldolase [Pseudobacteroides cellulosolvens ATCC 35603 = DSM 2933]